MNNSEIIQNSAVEYDLDTCPMPPEGTDLSQVNLSTDQRIWLAMAIKSKRFKTRQLADKWNMTYRKVFLCYRRLLGGGIPSGNCGRPKILDALALQTVKHAIVECKIRDIRILKLEVDDAYTDTYKRRRSCVQDVSNLSLEMSKRSRTRYISQIRHGSL
jgi:hypothetical protein